MWRVSQKIHRGSLAFFGKWDKINRIRGDATAPEVRRPVESPGRQPSLGKGAEGTGGTDCHDQFANWSRNDTLQGVRCVVGRRTEASAPTDSLIAGEGGTM